MTRLKPITSWRHYVHLSLRTQTSSKIKGAFLFCGAASWQLKVAGKVIRIVAADKHALAELQGIMDVKAQAKVAELKKQAKEAATSPPEQV